MKFNPLSLLKAVSETLSHSKEYEEKMKEMTKEPIQGFNETGTVCASFDSNTCRFTRIDVKTKELEGRDLVEVFEEITAAVNDALSRADELWEKMTPDAVRKIDRT